jgi:hypothetical protein
VTPDRPKRSSESDFDSDGAPILAYSKRTRGPGGDKTRPVRLRSREDRAMLKLLAMAGLALFAVAALASIAAAALSVFIFPG